MQLLRHVAQSRTAPSRMVWVPGHDPKHRFPGNERVDEKARDLATTTSEVPTPVSTPPRHTFTYMLSMGEWRGRSRPRLVEEDPSRTLSRLLQLKTTGKWSGMDPRWFLRAPGVDFETSLAFLQPPRRKNHTNLWASKKRIREWKWLMGTLPVLRHLSRCSPGIYSNPTCLRCGEEEETIAH